MRPRALVLTLGFLTLGLVATAALAGLARAQDRFGAPLPPGAVARFGILAGTTTPFAIALERSPDGRTFAWYGNDTVHVWDMAELRELSRIPTGGYGSFVFVHGGKALAVTRNDGSIRTIDVATAKVLKVREGAVPVSRCQLAASGDGETIATVATSGTLNLLDARTLETRRTLDARGKVDGPIAFSADGKLVATSLDYASPDVAIFDAATGELVRTARAPSGSRVAIALSPDGARLALAGDEENVAVARVEDTRTGARSKKLTCGLPCRSNALAFSADSKTLAWGCGTRLQLHDAVSGDELREVALPWSCDANLLAFSKDGARLVVGNQLCFVDVTKGLTLPILAGDHDRVLAVAPSTLSVLSVTRDHFVLMDGAGTPLWFVPIPVHFRIAQATFAPDGKTFAWAGDDDGKRGIHLVDTATGKEIKVFVGHEGGTLHAAFSPDGKKIASVAHDEVVRIWDVATGKEIAHTGRGHMGFPFAVTFSPDGGRVLSVDDEACVCSWNAKTGALLKKTERRAPPAPQKKGESRATGGSTAVELSFTGSDPIKGHAFSPDRSLLAVNYDNTIHLIAVSTGRDVGTLAIADGPSQSGALAFSPDGKLLASAGAKGASVALWDVGARRRVFTCKSPSEEGSLASVVFSPDGKRVYSSMQTGSVLVWDAGARAP